MAWKNVYKVGIEQCVSYTATEVGVAILNLHPWGWQPPERPQQPRVHVDVFPFTHYNG